jgi:hypothetical protein
LQKARKDKGFSLSNKTKIFDFFKRKKRLIRGKKLMHRPRQTPICNWLFFERVDKLLNGGNL